MSSRSPQQEQRHMLEQMVQEAWQTPNWNGTALCSALRRVGPEMAAWRPPLARRSIADIVAHCAYWKYAVARRLTAAARGGFPLKGSNWFATPASLSPAAWSELRDLLRQQHEAMVDAIRSPRATAAWTAKLEGEEWTPAQRVFWLAIHDGYHTGQVNLIKAMYRRAHK